MHTSLESRTAVLCAGRWIPPKCDLRERADVFFPVALRERDTRLRDLRRYGEGHDLLVMRARDSYHYESACILLANFYA